MQNLSTKTSLSHFISPAVSIFNWNTSILQKKMAIKYLSGVAPQFREPIFSALYPWIIEIKREYTRDGMGNREQAQLL